MLVDEGDKIILGNRSQCKWDSLGIIGKKKKSMG